MAYLALVVVFVFVAEVAIEGDIGVEADLRHSWMCWMKY